MSFNIPTDASPRDGLNHEHLANSISAFNQLALNRLYRGSPSISIPLVFHFPSEYYAPQPHTLQQHQHYCGQCPSQTPNPVTEDKHTSRQSFTCLDEITLVDGIHGGKSNGSTLKQIMQGLSGVRFHIRLRVTDA